MRNPLTIRVETRFGVIVILFWATLFSLRVINAVSDFSDFLVLMHVQTPLSKSALRLEYGRIDRWLELDRLNPYGDAEGTVYAGGTPLFDEETGEAIDRYTYFMRKFPERSWRSK